MPLVTLNHIKKSYGDRLLYEIDHIQIEDQDRIGLVGANGSGKTTLFRLITGQGRSGLRFDRKAVSYRTASSIKRKSCNKKRRRNYGRIRYSGTQQTAETAFGRRTDNSLGYFSHQLGRKVFPAV